MARIDLLDQLLPGRTGAEDEALAPSVRAVEVAERRYQSELAKPLPSTDRGYYGRQERLTSLQQGIAHARAALRARLEQLAEERLAMLPDDATDIGHGGGGGDLWDDRRYPVVCRSSGQLVSLGGCMTLGPAQDRVRWFQDAAERRGDGQVPVDTVR